MPDDAGNFKGLGWSRKSADAWERVFGDAGSQQQSTADWALAHAGTQRTDEHVPTFDELPAAVRARVDPESVPHEPPHEDLDERADRDEAAGWGR